MIEALKNTNKKFLYIALILILIPILIIIILAIAQGCSNSKTSYEGYEKKMISATKKYLTKEKMLPTNEGETLQVSLTTLISKNYIKSTTKLLDEECTGTVDVILTGSLVEENEGGMYNYLVDLSCSKYSSTHLSEK